jgi:hypothetical protein
MCLLRPLIGTACVRETLLIRTTWLSSLFPCFNSVIFHQLPCACVRSLNKIYTLHSTRFGVLSCYCPVAAAVQHRRDNSSVQVALPVISLTLCGQSRFAFLCQPSNFCSNCHAVPARSLSLSPHASGFYYTFLNKELTKYWLWVPVHQCRMLH